MADLPGCCVFVRGSRYPVESKHHPCKKKMKIAYSLIKKVSYPFAKWRLEQKAKEQALAQVEEESRFKEVAEASNQRKLQALSHKIETDFQRHKDDLQQLELDLSRLKASAQTTALPKGDVAWMVRDFDRLVDSSEKDVCGDRECLISMNDEVSVVFLPCAHVVLCANCNGNYGKKGRATCPRCRVPIEQRSRVFGATL